MHISTTISKGRITGATWTAPNLITDHCEGSVNGPAKLPALPNHQHCTLIERLDSQRNSSSKNSKLTFCRLDRMTESKGATTVSMRITNSFFVSLLDVVVAEVGSPQQRNQPGFLFLQICAPH